MNCKSRGVCNEKLHQTFELYRIGKCSREFKIYKSNDLFQKCSLHSFRRTISPTKFQQSLYYSDERFFNLFQY